MPVDFNGAKWITQSEFAEAHNVTLACVCQYIKRKNVVSRYFPDVKRKMIKVGSLMLSKQHKPHPENELDEKE